MWAKFDELPRGKRPGERQTCREWLCHCTKRRAAVAFVLWLLPFAFLTLAATAEGSDLFATDENEHGVPLIFIAAFFWCLLAALCVAICFMYIVFLYCEHDAKTA